MADAALRSFALEFIPQRDLRVPCPRFYPHSAPGPLQRLVRARCAHISCTHTHTHTHIPYTHTPHHTYTHTHTLIYHTYTHHITHTYTHLYTIHPHTTPHTCTCTHTSQVYSYTVHIHTHIYYTPLHRSYTTQCPQHSKVVRMRFGSLSPTLREYPSTEEY